MGGSTTAIPVVNWRGTDVSRDMVAPLDDLAASVAPLVTPIAGFGSYRDNTASGGTDNGSGHCDIYAGNGWTDADRKAFVANARQRGFYAAYRTPTWWSPVRQKWITATWGRHFHLILKDSADLSSGARTQLSEWYAGSNGLAGFWWNGVWRHDPDDGPRTFLRQTWPQYLATVPEEDIMASIDDLRTVIRQELAATPKAVWEYPLPGHDSNPSDDVKPNAYPARSYVVMANWRASDLQARLDPAALAKAVAAALPANTPVTDEQLEGALRKVLGSLDQA